MSLLRPGRYLPAVTSLDLESLWAAGKRVLLLDRDNTLVPRDAHRAPDDVVAWLARARSIGFRLCLVSNNWAKNVRPDAEQFGAQLVSRAAKPLPFGLWRALRKVGGHPSEAVLVGDQVFTDVLGARLAGIDSVLVRPQAEKDLAHTLVLRRVEALVLAGVPLEDEAESGTGRQTTDGAAGGSCRDGDHRRSSSHPRSDGRSQ